MVTLVMTPPPGERLLRFVGDRVRFTLRTASGAPLPRGWRVLLRTNVGRGHVLRHEIIHSYPHRPPLAGAAWHDIEMEPAETGGAPAAASFQREVTLTEPGFFRAKAYAVDPHGYQHWPDGDDIGISVHPDQYRTANTIYCAFIRMFGPAKPLAATADPDLEKNLAALDAAGYTVIPSSGKIRDLIRELPFIIDTLGCRILQLLPVNPTPTTFAKFGRFGSPYASLDLTAVDLALVEFDKRTTGIDQFRELTYAAHARGARVFIDIVINHTGWGARLQEIHPPWYVRDERGNFVSPGAWGVTWEDLAELDHRTLDLWQELADVFLTWCRRGVDGFRCDAGYKVPLRAWRYITARVLDEFPDTVFLLEGLGGSWEATELLLTEGGMQWAYSELFQNYSGIEVASYLEYALRQSDRLGLYVHYSETHDNDRLARRGRAWSLLRNRLCALSSVSGAFAFTCGVEWLATEKIRVHGSTGLAWGSPENIVPDLARLNSLLREHPCFFDGAKLTRVTAPDSPVYALLREAAGGSARVLVVANTDTERAQLAVFDPALFAINDRPQKTFNVSLIRDALGQELPGMQVTDGRVAFEIPAAAVYCLELTPHGESQGEGAPPLPSGEGRGEGKPRIINPAPATLSLESPVSPASALRQFGTAAAMGGGAQYRAARARAAWAISIIGNLISPENIGPFDWRVLADWVDRDPKTFLGAAAELDPLAARRDLLAALFERMEKRPYPPIVTWQLLDLRRIMLVPADHWLLVCDPRPFRATLTLGQQTEHLASIETSGGNIAAFAPRGRCDATLDLERYYEQSQRVSATLRCLGRNPDHPAAHRPRAVLLTNGRGGMARLRTDLGAVESKYDCLLGANLHPSLPVDRHILAKRVRAWLVADGFITALNAENLVEFSADVAARWRFVCSAGNGRALEIDLTAEMLPGQNTTVLSFRRAAHPPRLGASLPATARVSVTVRIDIEDRNFHTETHHNGAAEYHFSANTRRLPGNESRGFEFTPANDRQLRVCADRGQYHAGPEWCDNIPHPIEASRGQVAAGDAYSPGWFEIPLEIGQAAALTITAELGDIGAVSQSSLALERDSGGDAFEQALARAAAAFVVRRGQAVGTTGTALAPEGQSTGKTVIAGYPWFLDWGRDTLICARGLIAAGRTQDVRDILVTFARFEENGTLPNTIHGENASNRDTSDAPLWFGIACEEMGPAFAATVVDARGRTITDILRSIAVNYRRGTPNGIRVDAASGLVWSPSHFTWMDTNFPAGTPREGYPVEIQVLWIRLLQQLARFDARPDGESWDALAARALESLRTFFWFEDSGYFADVLSGPATMPARNATPDNALRSNYLFAVSLGLVTADHARRCVDNAARYLVIPGALRSLAPLPVSPPLAVRRPDGALLNDPLNPYWARYEGDEDTRRKPAYHNGTGWLWTFPTFCEALALAWDTSPPAVAAAQSYLLSMRGLMDAGCAGQLAEICDGDAPHSLRGCDAQAWSVTEALRVWKWLRSLKRETGS